MSDRQSRQGETTVPKARARELRRDQTHVERQLWHAIRGRQLGGLKFRRQVPIGPYIVDFACPARRLVIELDGGQHGERRRDDDDRTRALAAHGFRVVRFWNNEVTDNLIGVLESIRAALQN